MYISLLCYTSLKVRSMITTVNEHNGVNKSVLCPIYVFDAFFKWTNHVCVGNVENLNSFYLLYSRNYTCRIFVNVFWF